MRGFFSLMNKRVSSAVENGRGVGSGINVGAGPAILSDKGVFFFFFDERRPENPCPSVWFCDAPVKR